MPYFLQLPGLPPGTVTDQQHIGWTDVKRYAIGVANRGNPRDATHQTAADFEAVQLESPCDHLFPELTRYCGEVTPFDTVTLEVATGGAAPVVLHRIILTKAIVKKVSHSSSEAMTMLLDFTYDKIRIESRKPDGTYAITTYNCV